MPSDHVIMVSDVLEAENAARHAGLIAITEDANGVWFHFNNRASILVKANGIQVLEVHHGKAV